MKILLQASPRGYVPALAVLLLVGQFATRPTLADSTRQPAKPPEPRNQTYRMIGGRSVISLVSSDELEIREDGQNIVCKYTKQDGKLRVVVSALGTTTAKYFDITPQGLVGEDGGIYYEPATYEKVMAQIELNRQLWAAVEKDDAKAIDELIVKGAAVESRDNSRSALIMAIEEGKTNAPAPLLKHRADPNQRVGNNGETAIWRAIVNGNIATVELLLKHGARASDKRNDGATPLMLAASLGGGWSGPQRKPEHDKIVSILCEAKVDLNVQDHDGYSALGCSLRSGNLEATKILVAAGADRESGKDVGRDAYTLAATDARKVDAIRTPAERNERKRIGDQNSRLFVGVWHWDGSKKSVWTCGADGTIQWKRDDDWGDMVWSIDGDILTYGKRPFRLQILELTDSTLVLKQETGERDRATRVLSK